MASNLIWTKFIGLWCVLLEFRFFLFVLLTDDDTAVDGLVPFFMVVKMSFDG